MAVVATPYLKLRKKQLFVGLLERLKGASKSRLFGLTSRLGTGLFLEAHRPFGSLKLCHAAILIDWSTKPIPKIDGCWCNNIYQAQKETAFRWSFREAERCFQKQTVWFDFQIGYWSRFGRPSLTYWPLGSVQRCRSAILRGWSSKLIAQREGCWCYNISRTRTEKPFPWLFTEGERCFHKAI